jgi:Uncharacterized conserved protein (DUF2190)
MTGQFESTPNPEVIMYDGITPIKLGFTATSAITKGDEVVISGNMTVDKRTGATQRPIGFADNTAASGQKVTIRLFGLNVFKGKLAANLSANAFVRQNGTAVNADGTNNYAAAANTNYATGILLEGGSTGDNVKIAIISPVLM